MGLQHSLLLPKVGGTSQNSPESGLLYMIPMLSAVTGPKGSRTWANETVKSAYQSVLRNALKLHPSKWKEVSTVRWGSRDDPRIVPPQDVPPSGSRTITNSSKINSS
eukprot:5433601-Amphidinium_carterae.3